MATVFNDDIFIKNTLWTVDKSRHVIVTLTDPSSGRYNPDLLRQDGTGILYGHMIDPVHIPEWLVNGTILILDSTDESFKATLTYQPTKQSRIRGLTEILGDKVKFSYVVTTEFKDV